MATTSRGIVYPVVGDALTPLANHFANLATSTNTAIDNAINPIVNGGRSFYGTTAGRASVTGMKLGDTYQESDGSKKLWRYDGAGWAPGGTLTSFGTVGTQSGIIGATTVAGISIPITLPSSATLRVSGQVPTYATVVDTVVEIALLDGATKVAGWTKNANSSISAASTTHIHNFELYLPSVSAGTHTYTIQVSRAAGTGAITVQTTAIYTSFLTVSLVQA